MSPDPSTSTTPLDPQIAAVAAEIEAAPLTTPEEAEAFRIRFLGRRSGAVTDLLGQLGQAPPEQRRALGQRLNALKARAQARLDEAEAARDAAPASAATDPSAGAGRALDLTLPGRVPPPLDGPEGVGGLHPITQTLRAIEQIFQGFGFSVARGPEIESDWHNFTALNFPPEHPARDMQDTFFLERPPPEGRGVVLRTHTSPVQVRVMEAGVRARTGPPFRVIAPGRVFRNEAISYKSFCLFHQVEGLVVDEGVTFADLKAVLHAFARAFYGAGVRMRFRPSYFPFTEPSAEVDIWWADADRERSPDGGRWLEILGCGMVDPAVLENVGIDPERYTGYAFGMGVERQAMLRHDVPDIRLLYENDVRFLRQF